jgi:hypothetical protein
MSINVMSCAMTLDTTTHSRSTQCHFNAERVYIPYHQQHIARTTHVYTKPPQIIMPRLFRGSFTRSYSPSPDRALYSSSFSPIRDLSPAMTEIYDDVYYEPYRGWELQTAIHSLELDEEMHRRARALEQREQRENLPRLDADMERKSCHREYIRSLRDEDKREGFRRRREMISSFGRTSDGPSQYVTGSPSQSHASRTRS